MRESIGGGWLFGIVIVFIFLFSAFLTYSISYTKAFNVKNEVINYIEHNEGFQADDSVDNERNTDVLLSKVQGKIKYLINQVGYDYESNGKVECPGGSADKNNFYGVCIIKICPNGDKESNTHYKITTYINLEIPIIGANMNIPITGETRSIYQDKYGFECSKEE